MMAAANERMEDTKRGSFAPSCHLGFGFFIRVPGSHHLEVIIVARTASMASRVTAATMATKLTPPIPL